MDDYLNSLDPSASSLLKEFLSNSNISRNFNNKENFSTFYLLNKASVIQSIREQIAYGSIPEGILDSLQIIQLLDREQGLPVSDSLRAAFCAVAVHCTLIWLPLSWSCYFDAVQRIWRFRIRNLEDSLNNQLFCPDLAKWRDDVEAALWDSDTSERLSRTDTLYEALQRIRVYLDEIRSSMKPAFLRPMADHIASVAQTHSPPHTCTDKGKSNLEVDHQTKYNLRSSHHLPNTSLSAPPNTSLSVPPNTSLSTPEVKKLQDALKSSTADLLAAVTDPLPEALEVAERVEKDLHAKAVGEDVNRDIHQNNVVRPSIMERNGTARTYEWEDSIDATSEGKTSSSNTCHLPSPKVKRVSPLKKHINPKWVRKRKINRWSVEEEKALAEGVRK
ncbi:hypothetical protein PTKIN_Ptkin13bG0167600 [Pterospermum kingtungense]